MSETLSFPRRYGAGDPTTARVDVEVIGDRPVAVVTEIAANRGLSVTNNAEMIVECLRERYGSTVVVVEHYDEGSYEGRESRPETFDLVAVRPAGGNAEWTHLGQTLSEALGKLRELLS